jgi:tetratricopeptide (TPR) repeat protein
MKAGNPPRNEGFSVPRSWRQAVATGLALLLSFRFTATVVASPASTALIRCGLQALGAGQLEQARERFESAARADPTDSDAEFFVGAALNRLARAPESLTHLERARAMGNANDDLDFETGWGLLMLRDWSRARDKLEAYERDHPGRGLTSEFLGRAYLGLREDGKAAASFDKAVALDPDLKPSVDLYRVQLAAASGGTSAGMAAAERLLSLAPAAGSGWPGEALGPGRYGSVAAVASPLAAATLLAPQAPGTMASRPWRLELSIGGGYDSNARGLEADIETGTPKGENSGFGQFALDAAWFFVNTPEQRLAAGVDIFDRTYTRQDIDSDYLNPEIYVQLDQQVARHLSASVRISEDYTLVNGANFRSQVGARPALDWEITPALRAEAAYGYAFNDYLFPRPVPALPSGGFADVLNETADVHTVTAALYWAPPGTGIKVRGGYLHIWNFARGADYVFEANGAFAGLTVPLPGDITVDLGYEYTLERYSNIDSSTLGAGAAAERHRRDPIDGVSVRFTRPLGPQLTAYLEYDLNVDRSNLNFFRYTDNVIGAGVIWRF